MSRLYFSVTAAYGVRGAEVRQEEGRLGFALRCWRRTESGARVVVSDGVYASRAGAIDEAVRFVDTGRQP